MNLNKLIGFKLDTNQFTSKTIENVDEVKMYLDKVIKIYGKDIIKQMYLTDDKRYTTYKKDGISLYDILNNY